MISITIDYDGFADRFSNYLKESDESFNVCIIEDSNPEIKVCGLMPSPFCTNPCVISKGSFPIVYNPRLIAQCEFTQQESDACLLHEIGHIKNKNSTKGTELEIICDKEAVEAGMSLPMLSALYKMQNKLGLELQERINSIIQNLHLFRPEWTCGRYNQQKQVAIMYNLIAGFSYFFDNYSARVVGEVLNAGRNDDINVIHIAEVTGICMESLCQFFSILTNCGLLTESIPEEKGILSYRREVLQVRRENRAWVDKQTKEKLPMAVTNAEQAYFSAVDDGRTICSCMFELTYRCSEMCIHCYNPGASRNCKEVSHRAEYKELSLEDYKRIIDDMYDNGLVKVCLSGGDPFSQEFIWDILDYLYAKSIAVDIYTNGQRILNKVRRVADYHPRLIGISIYSGLPEVHDAITRIPGSWKKSMQVVKELHELAVPMNLKCCIMQPNLHSYYMVADIAKDYDAIPQFEINISESNDGDICAKQLRLTERQLQVVLRDNNLALYVGKEAPNYGGQKRDMSLCSCGAGGTGFCMSPNGDLRACAAFTQVYGNLSQQSLRSIISGSQNLREWRTAVVSQYKECGEHDYCDYCNLCAGLNYSEHGDFRKPAESNCFLAKCRHNLAKRLMTKDEPMTREEFIQELQKLPIEKYDLRRMYRTNG